MLSEVYKNKTDNKKNLLRRFVIFSTRDIAFLILLVNHAEI